MSRTPCVEAATASRWLETATTRDDADRIQFAELIADIKLPPDITNTRERTTAITNGIARLAQHYRWPVKREVRSGFAGQVNPHRPGWMIRDRRTREGWVDLMVTAPQGIIYVEIDSWDKRWSVQKLRRCVELGGEAVWVRWGSKESLSRPTGPPPSTYGYRPELDLIDRTRERWFPIRMVELLIE